MRFCHKIILISLLLNAVSYAVSTSAIETVINKPVLDPASDYKVIDDFVAKAIDELVNTEDFSNVSKIRSVIKIHQHSKKDSAKAQYAEQFSKSANKYLSAAFAQAAALTPQGKQFNITLNLLILVDELGDVKLINFAVEKLSSENPVIRYWAVHAVSNPKITEQLNAIGASNLKTIKDISVQLDKLVNKVDISTLVLIAGFGSEIKSSEAEKILLKVADMRIENYSRWNVEDELIEANILKGLSNRLVSNAVDKPALARRFAQLYSYVIQRYSRGKDLSDSSKKHLPSVIAEVESACIGRTLGMPQRALKDALGTGDNNALMIAHNELLGDETKAGKLAEKITFDYGSGRTSPLILPDPPAKTAK